MYNYYDPNCKHAGKGRYTELQIGPVQTIAASLVSANVCSERHWLMLGDSIAALLRS